MSTIKKLSSAIIFKSASNILSMFFALCVSVILNRFYGKETYGLLVLAYSVISFCFLLSDFGSKQTVNRFLPLYLKNKQEAKLANLMSWSVRLQLAGIIIFGAILFFLSDFIAGVILKRPEVSVLLKVGVLYFLAYCALDFIFQLFQALQKWLWESLLNILYLLSYLLLCVFLIYIFRASLSWILVANFLAAILICLAAFIIFARKHYFGIKGSFSVPEKGELRMLVGFSFPLLLNNLVFFIWTWLDKILLGRFASMEQLTFYYIAFSLYSGIIVLIKTLYSVFMPYLAEITENALKDIRIKFIKVIRFFTHSSILLAIAGFIVVDPLVELLYGRSYMSVAFAFKLFAIIIIIRGIKNPIGMFTVNVFSLPGKLLMINIFSAVVIIGLNLALIPLFGYKGAILAVGLSELFWIILTLVIVKQFREIMPFRSLLISIFSFVLTIGFYIFILVKCFNFYFAWILNLGLAVIFYVALIFIFQELKKSEIVAIRLLIQDCLKKS